MSKGLEALEIIKHTTDLDRPNELNGYHNEICDIEKELEALEIIKEKEINVFIFLHSGDLETYNDMVEDNRKLTQEEYEPLKEVLL